jgi:5'-methylthioadenosine phosphorylase
LDIVIPDQYFDRTRSRPNTFFGRGIAVHISFDEPVCPRLSDIVYRTAAHEDVQVHRGGTYLVIEGPAFSTKGESRIYRQWGVDIIGMTALPEAKLAREAEICYTTLALVSDYDVWHESEAAVSVDLVMRNLSQSTVVARRIIQKVLPLLGGEPQVHLRPRFGEGHYYPT